MPSGATFDPAAPEAAAQDYRLPLPGGAAVTSARSVSYPAGTAAVVAFTQSGQHRQVAVMVEHNREWVFVLSTAAPPRPPPTSTT